MRKLLIAALVAVVFAAPAPARAVIFLGVRGGYALPWGDVARGQPIRDTVRGTAPIQVDLGTSVLPYVGLGLYGSYGYTAVGTTAKQSCGGSCTGQNYRAGLQLNLRVPILDSLWAGVFGGYEQQSLSGGGYSLTLRGWEGGVQGGWDFSLLPLLRAGPFVSYSVAQFQHSSQTLGEKSNHTQFTVGLRALFDL